MKFFKLPGEVAFTQEGKALIKKFHWFVEDLDRVAGQVNMNVVHRFFPWWYVIYIRCKLLQHVISERFINFKRRFNHEKAS